MTDTPFADSTLADTPVTDTPAKTILVLAYSISPVRGSEYAVGWNYVTAMSKHHRLIVLYGLAGDHMGDIAEIADMTPPAFDHPVRFVPVLPGRFARLANALNRANIVPFSFYIAYRDWHRSAARIARDLVATEQVDVVHYLCPIGYREPGYLGTIDRPYIWGPIGGIAPRPIRQFFSFGLGVGLKTVARNVVNGLQFRLNPRLSRAIARADVLLANTTENQAMITDAYRRTPLLMPENAIVEVKPRAEPHDDAAPLQLIWAGTLETRKALEYALEGLSGLASRDWILHVVGNGPRRAMLEAYANELGIAANIRWTGHIPRAAVIDIFRNADIHLITSLAEGHTTVLWEAMSLGVPTIAFDHCGMHDTLCDACGIRIPLGSRAQMGERLGAAIGTLIADRARVRALSDGTTACACHNDWHHRAARWNALYDVAIARFSDRRA